MKLLCLPLAMLLYLVTVTLQADPMDKIAGQIRQGDIHGLAVLFAPSIEMTVLDSENVYSKAQAEIVLEKFFGENKVRSVQTLHKIASNRNYRFGVLTVTAIKGTYRIAYTLKQTGGNLSIIEMRIETEKVK